MGGKSKIDIPQEYTIHLNPVQLQGSVGTDIQLSGNPEQPLTIDAGLDDVNVGLTGNRDQPVTIDLGLDHIKIAVEPLKVDMGLDDINVCLGLALTQIPRVRIHVPTRYEFGLNLFSVPIFNFMIGGETMLVTEDNPPRLFSRASPAVGREKGGRVAATTVAAEHKINLTDDEAEPGG